MAKQFSAEFLILAIVLMVAAAGAYVSNAGGAVVVIEGKAQTGFARPLGGLQQGVGGFTNYQCQQNAEGVIECCWLEDETWVCNAPSGSFGASRNMREGGEKTYATSPSRGYQLG